jgi:hypothetical protein
VKWLRFWDSEAGSWAGALLVTVMLIALLVLIVLSGWLI